MSTKEREELVVSNGETVKQNGSKDDTHEYYYIDPDQVAAEDENIDKIMEDLNISELRPNHEIPTTVEVSSESGDADSYSGAMYSRIDDVDSLRRGSGDTGSVRSRNSNGSVVSSEKTDEIWAEDTDTMKQPVSILKKSPADVNYMRSDSLEKKSPSVTKGPMKVLKDIRRKSITKLTGEKPPQEVYEQTNYDYTKVKVDRLPQRFVCKFLGSKPIRGLHGIKHVRNQIDLLVEETVNLKKDDEVPLAQVTVWEKGIQINPHPKSKSKVEECVRPIEFVSFCVQDVKYFKIVAFIFITEMTKSTRKAECHVYVCDSPCSARRLALSVAIAFKKYGKVLGEKRPKMQVDLRTVNEIEMDLKSGVTKDHDSDA